VGLEVRVEILVAEIRGILPLGALAELVVSRPVVHGSQYARR
jgi:hypothetical protein